MMEFKYTENQLIELKKTCPNLAQVINKCGKINRTVYPDFFTAFGHIIIEQQISVKAAENIFAKLLQCCSPFTPKKYLSLAPELVKKCGLSSRKARYIANCAKLLGDSTLDITMLNAMPDTDIITELKKLDGVGEWSAQMLLIFYFCRQNILSVGDFGIRNGLCLLYDKSAISKQDIVYYTTKFSPNCTLAGFYLWKINENPNLLKGD